MIIASVLLTSLFLFTIGLIGLFKQNNVVRVLISIEIMILASVLNFCCLTNNFDGIFALIFVILSGIIISLVYAICTTQLREENIEFLSEEQNA